YLLGILTGIKSTNPVKKTAESRDQGDIGRQISTFNSGTHLNVETDHKRNKRKKDGLEIYMAIIHTFTMGAVVWYAILTHSLLKTNNLTVQEIQKQTIMIRQQLVGSQGAVVKMNGPVGAGPLPDLGKNINISFGFKNEGHVNASALHIRVVIGKTLVSGDKWIDNPIPCDFTIMTLAPDKPEYRQCFFTILPSDMKAIASLKETIAINGTYTYENGFGDLKAEPMCFRYFPHVRTKYGLEGS